MIKKENKQSDTYFSKDKAHIDKTCISMIQISSLGNPEKTESCF
jgi:hypothetical protein